MYRALAAIASLAIAIMPTVRDAAAEDRADALLGAAVGAIVGGATGAAIASQGEARPSGYHYYQDGCYRQRHDGAWVAVAPQYCGAEVPAEYFPPAPPPPPVAVVHDELRDRMFELRGGCEAGDRRACVQLGIIIGENRERRAAWRREYPDVFFYER